MTSDKNLVLDLSLIFDENGYIDKTVYISENGDLKFVSNEIVEHITLIQSIDSPIKIDDNFLCNYTALISIDISKLVNVSAIGNNFLYGCARLETLDISNLSSLTTIGNHFLCSCSGLETLNISNLTSLTTIEFNSLGFCYNLMNIYMTNLTSVTLVNYGFLYNCYPKIFVNKISDYLYDRIKQYKTVQSYVKPIIYLDNKCVI